MARSKNPLVSLNASAVPGALKDAKRWAPWAAVWKEKQGKYDKVPKRADEPNYGLSTAKPERWFSFGDAIGALSRHPGLFAGVGYCMTVPHGIVGVDLDHCVDEAGGIEPWAREVIDTLGSYTEKSPSGAGLRVFLRGEVATDWTNHERGIEVYGGHEPRFLTVTGAHLHGTPDEIKDVAPSVLIDLANLYAKEKIKSDPIDLGMPDILDEIFIPDVGKLPLPDKVSRFLVSGDVDGDRSGALHAAGVALYSLGMGDDDVFSTLATNTYALTVALDHRRQDYDRALAYLWREHCVKAKPKASTVASADEFEAVTLPEGSPKPLPSFDRDGKGRIEATLNNLALALARPDVCGLRVGLDEFRDSIMYAPHGGGAWQPWGDADAVRLRQYLERHGFKPIGRELMRDAILLAADNGRFDSAADWLGNLRWDGVPRIENFYSEYFGATSSEYTKAAGRYTWTALAARVMNPGCKVDMVPILVGDQGLKKSSAVAAISPDSECFAEVDLAARDDDLSRRMRGCLVAEIGELRGLHSRDLESIKAFITRTHENWVPKFKEFATKFPRRLVFFGTTNKDYFLADETGNRRWLPIKVGRADAQAVARDRDQLWAEGAALYKESGVAYAEVEALATEQHEAYEMPDAWEDAIAQWLAETDLLTGDMPSSRGFLRVRDVMRNALNFTDSQIKRGDEMRVAAILRKLGYARRKVREGKGTFWAFVPSRS